jgi:hypothetical protein
MTMVNMKEKQVFVVEGKRLCMRLETGMKLLGAKFIT